MHLLWLSPPFIFYWPSPVSTQLASISRLTHSWGRILTCKNWNSHSSVTEKCLLGGYVVLNGKWLPKVRCLHLQDLVPACGDNSTASKSQMLASRGDLHFNVGSNQWWKPGISYIHCFHFVRDEGYERNILTESVRSLTQNHSPEWEETVLTPEHQPSLRYSHFTPIYRAPIICWIGNGWVPEPVWTLEHRTLTYPCQELYYDSLFA
jgi:hypothetical protein